MNWIKSKWETSKPLVIGLGLAIVTVVVVVIKFIKRRGGNKSGVKTVKPR